MRHSISRRIRTTTERDTSELVTFNMTKHALIHDYGIPEAHFRKAAVLYFGDPEVEHIPQHWLAQFLTLLNKKPKRDQP